MIGGNSDGRDTFGFDTLNSAQFTRPGDIRVGALGTIL
jgi:hypothetical protein